MITTKPFIFVLMPFDSEFDDIYQLGIKATAEEANTYCERVDEQIFEERILDRIYNQISKADIIIADLTTKNANVFYETGFAHALNKKVILLTQNVDDIPFDLRHHTHIIYDGKITKLKEELSKRINWIISNPTERELPNASLQYFVEGFRIKPNERIIIERSTLILGFHAQEIKIDIYNDSSTPYKLPFNIGVVSVRLIKGSGFKDGNLILLPDERILAISQDVTYIHPNSWVSLSLGVTLSWNFGAVVYTDPLELELQVFNELGTEKIPFTIEINYISSLENA